MALLLAFATGLELAAALGDAGLAAAQPQGEALEREAYGRRVLTLVTGVGPLNAALHLGRVLARGGVDGVLSLGVAGSFDLRAHPLGSVRLVEAEIWPEYGLARAGQAAADALALGFPQHGEGAGAVYQRLDWEPGAELARMGLEGSGLARAQSLTVAGVTADAARAAELFGRFGAGLENMEGFALGYACRMAGAPFAELRAVSNAVGSRPPRDWDLPGALEALGRAARLLLAAGA